MDLTPRNRLTLRLQGAASTILILAVVGLLAYLSARHTWQADWTASQRNSLTDASRELLTRLDDPVAVTSWATETDAVRNAVRELVERYRRHKSDIALTFQNPDTDPARARELAISVDGELVIDYQGRSERLKDFSEQGFTNALQRVARAGERWLVFVGGHGERNPQGEANHDYGTLGKELEARGLKLRVVNLASAQAIPDNAAALVIASPQKALLPAEVALVRRHVEAGGNLLWLTEPRQDGGLKPVAELIGLTVLPGLIVDPNTQLLGIRDPAMALVPEYPDHPITREIGALSVYPQAAALSVKAPEGWQARPFLATLARSWNETGALTGTIRFDGTDQAGPLSLGIAWTRPRPGAQAAAGADAENDDSVAGQQRIAVIGDGDFLSNQFLGNGGNLDVGLSVLNWVAHDDAFLSIPAKAAVDTQLDISRGLAWMIGFGFLLLLPLGLVVAGVTIWLRRRKR